jgi:transcription elongation factor Elf1
MEAEEIRAELKYRRAKTITRVENTSSERYGLIYWVFRCPTCGRSYIHAMTGGKTTNAPDAFCSVCGQRLNWGDYV